MFGTLLRTAALLSVTASVAGCEHWLARRDAVSYQAGDALAWNKAMHMIDPWPAASADATIPASGRRIAKVIERYESGEREADDLSAPAGHIAPTTAQ